jgi:osmotically inducible lipoprotein OsmB
MLLALAACETSEVVGTGAGAAGGYAVGGTGGAILGGVGGGLIGDAMDQ